MGGLRPSLANCWGQALLALLLSVQAWPAQAQNCRGSTAFLNCVIAAQQAGRFTIPEDLTLPDNLPGRRGRRIDALFQNFEGPVLPPLRRNSDRDQGHHHGGGNSGQGGGNQGGSDGGDQGHHHGGGNSGQGGGNQGGGPGPSLPPTGVMPTVPGGVTPPIGTLPPTGVMPTVPGGVTPPIGTLPPTGVMPTVPGGVTPPIGTLPPTGVMPTVPGGVTPPIGTLPPTGVMPTVPGGVTPPIGTLPPTGVMPTVPGGVTPPIGTLPPTGVMPTVAGGVTPPIGTLPPPSGVRPERPALPSAPSVTLPPGTAARPPIDNSQIDRRRRVTSPPSVECVETRNGSRVVSPRDGATGECIVRDGQPVAPHVRSNSVPLTPGRDTAFETRWNAWSELTGVSLSDYRYGLDTRNRSSTATAGLDRQLTPDVVAGFSVGVQKSSGSGFNDLMRSSTDSFNVGPYIAVRVSDHWAIDASFNYSLTKSDVQILVLNGAATLSAYIGQVNLHGQYTFAEWFLRPKLTVSYTRNVSGDRDMSGTLLGLPISFTLPGAQSNYGLIEGYQEISRLFDLSNGYFAIPYTELGLHYAFERANGGLILAGDLTNVIPSAWSGSLRQGVRMQLPNAALIEASVGYLSLGMRGLDIWEGRLQFSFGF